MQKTPGKTPVAREKYWTKIIEEARKYPNGITEYCRVMNLSKNNYYFWFKRLRSKHPEWHDLSNHPEGVVNPTQSRKSNQPSDLSIQGLAAMPDPQTEVKMKATRRKWNATDREKILKETAGLPAGDVAAALRREGLYVLHTLNKWRTQRDLTNIARSKRPNGAPSPLSAENKKLKEENAKLQRKLQQANEIILLQKIYLKC